MIKKNIFLTVPLFLGFAAAAEAQEVIPLRGGEEQQDASDTQEQPETNPGNREIVIRENVEKEMPPKLTTAIGTGFTFRDSGNKTRNFYFPFSLNYKPIANLGLGLNGSAQIVRRTSDGDETGYEALVAGPNLGFNSRYLDLGVGLRFGTDSERFETSGEETTSVSVGTDIAIKPYEDLGLLASFSRRENLDDGQVSLYGGGFRKRIGKEDSLYGQILHRVDDLYNNRLTYAVASWIHRTKGLLTKLTGIGGQKFGGSFDLEASLSDNGDFALGLSAGASREEDETRVDRIDLSASVIFRK